MKYDAVPRQRLRLFESDLLERTTTISPRAFACIWLPILAGTLWFAWGKATVQDALGLWIAGLLGWTLFEYAMHRFLFHWKAKSSILRSVVFVTHGNHHVDPSDPHRNMMPPIISVPVSAAVWAVLLLAIGPAGTFAFLGFAIGYVSYDIAHYACHQLPMRRGVLRHLRRHHIRHHHARVEGNYAITAIMWDWVFRTRIPAKGR
jgi:sterol desaturase/sphingolipid hydroxylase (fatty acid hydroxylase superfamily)